MPDSNLLKEAAENILVSSPENGQQIVNMIKKSGACWIVYISILNKSNQKLSASFFHNNALLNTHTFIYLFQANLQIKQAVKLLMPLNTICDV